MKHETKARILLTMFNDLRHNVDNLSKEATTDYDDCAAEWYTNEIVHTTKAILEFYREINKDKV